MCGYREPARDRYQPRKCFHFTLQAAVLDRALINPWLRCVGIWLDWEELKSRLNKLVGYAGAERESQSGLYGEIVDG